MAYKIFVEVGKGKNKSTSGSTPLPNKSRVENWIRRSPLIRSNTKIKVTNTRTGKITTGTQGRFYKNPTTNKFRF